MKFSHIPVMLGECIENLNIRPDGIYVDATTGGAGHSAEIAKRLKKGRLYCIDRDSDALAAAKLKLSDYSRNITFIKSNFGNLHAALEAAGCTQIDGILFDLGVSSYQLDEPGRGFSYMNDGPLDMRMDRNQALTAYDVVNGWPEEELKRILFEYGEERYAKRIAAEIVNKRTVTPINTTTELSELIKSAMPAAAKREKQHPAKRSFQAIRIAVNSELEEVKSAVTSAVSLMKPEGRIAVITFHSLEDRIVKTVFSQKSKGCICPPDFPVCVCGIKPELKLVSRKAILPNVLELEQNPRSRSAKLRVAEKV
ncbi:MAG: 16S rRNA (cytosine(1402)-N(4))-methyltransferase RsmH [Clostridiales bacterium]|nr:16S rRNA (cytosine(1402)-N(4))-methyltransferase RsmH [Clostridiales bacterium]